MMMRIANKNRRALIYWLIMTKPIEPAPVRPAITVDLLNQIDIRVGTIELVEDVKGSNKLVKLTVDFGDHKRSILAGMKQEREQVKEIEGKQALFVVNLEPRKMAGEMSEGMLFDIGYADGIAPALAVPERAVPNGSRAG
jgi:tRNA-binding protein